MVSVFVSLFALYIIETDNCPPSLGIWDFKLLTQPARSPDLNHLDLSFFRALERANFKHPLPLNIDQLIANVEQTFWQFDERVIEKGFVTLGLVCDEIIRCGGDNTYKLPHIGKDNLLHTTGSLPLRIRASQDVLEMARDWETRQEGVQATEMEGVQATGMVEV